MMKTLQRRILYELAQIDGEIERVEEELKKTETGTREYHTYLRIYACYYGQKESLKRMQKWMEELR